MPPENYEKYLERMNHLVFSELVPKAAIFDYFTRHATETEDALEENEPLIWYVRSGLHYDVTFSLYRLYDNNSDRNIYHFIDFAEQQASSIPWKTSLTSTDFTFQRSLLATVEQQKERLRKRRNKFFAHYDKKYFYEPDNITNDFPFSNSDAIEMIRVLQQIVGKHSFALHASAMISMEHVFYVAAEKLYKRIVTTNNDA